jgi:hypothetical protein
MLGVFEPEEDEPAIRLCPADKQNSLKYWSPEARCKTTDTIQGWLFPTVCYDEDQEELQGKQSS